MRLILQSLAFLLCLAVPGVAGERLMTITKNAGCGCCDAWADIARAHGFAVKVKESEDYEAYKKAHGVPLAVAGCHSARVGGYVVEGHVPMNAIDKLLAERPDVHGITVPGMPMGSPGMGDDPKAKFVTYTFVADKAGSIRPYVRHGEE